MSGKINPDISMHLENEALMSPQELVDGIRATVIDENTGIFKRLLSETSPEKASDLYWKRALTLFGNLSELDKGILLEIVKNTAIATTSHLLGILDGVNSIAVENSKMTLLNVDGRQLNGELQSIFLLLDESRT